MAWTRVVGADVVPGIGMHLPGMRRDPARGVDHGDLADLAVFIGGEQPFRASGADRPARIMLRPSGP